jgi:hypothetical protein
MSIKDRTIQVSTSIELNQLKICVTDSRDVSTNVTEDSVLEMKSNLFNANLRFIDNLIKASRISEEPINDNK